MKITVKNEIDDSKREIDLKANKVEDLLKELNLNAEEFLVVRNNEVLTTDRELNDQDVIELLSVISGG